LPLFADYISRLTLAPFRDFHACHIGQLSISPFRHARFRFFITCRQLRSPFYAIVSAAIAIRLMAFSITICCHFHAS